MEGDVGRKPHTGLLLPHGSQRNKRGKKRRPAVRTAVIGAPEGSGGTDGGKTGV